MNVNYLKKVLRAGVGTTFSKETQLESHNKPSYSEVQLQQSIQNRFPLSPMLWDNENELEDVDKGIIFDELIEDKLPIVKSGTMGDQDPGAKQKIESDCHLSKPTTNINGEIVKTTSFTQDNPLSVRKNADVNLHGTSQLNMGKPDVKRGEKEVNEDESRLQELEDGIDTQKLRAKKAQPEESNRIPTVEVVREDTIRVTRSHELSSPNSVFQLVGTNSLSQELTENKVPIPSDVEKPENIHKSETSVKAIEVLRKSTSQQDLNTHFFSESLFEPQPTTQQNLNTRFFTESLKKGESQTARINKDLASINKKLDEHITKEQSEPARPVFLPKRPPSRNLGGWSKLERNYIR